MRNKTYLGPRDVIGISWALFLFSSLPAPSAVLAIPSLSTTFIVSLAPASVTIVLHVNAVPSWLSPWWSMPTIMVVVVVVLHCTLVVGIGYPLGHRCQIETRNYFVSNERINEMRNKTYLGPRDIVGISWALFLFSLLPAPSAVLTVPSLSTTFIAFVVSLAPVLVTIVVPPSPCRRCTIVVVVWMVHAHHCGCGCGHGHGCQVPVAPSSPSLALGVGLSCRCREIEI
jgi:hypothetical protein